MTLLSRSLRTRWYWIALAAAGFALLVVALYYQYVLGDEPCQVCIHARLWVVAFTVIALFMAIPHQHRLMRLTANLGVFIACAGLTERATYLYQLENGIGDGSCEFELGMPSWFAVDQWMPLLFEVRNLCSFTPKMLFGFSMAESLMGIGAVLCLVAATAIAIDLFEPHQSALN